MDSEQSYPVGCLVSKDLAGRPFALAIVSFAVWKLFDFVQSITCVNRWDYSQFYGCLLQKGLASGSFKC